MTFRGCGRQRAHAYITDHSTFSRSLWIALLLVTASLTLPAAAEAATYTFTPVADGYTRSDAASTGYGTVNRISDRDSTKQQRISYLRFNVALLAGETITSATLKVFSTTSGTNVDLHDVVSNTWSESGLTWNSAPVHDSGVASHVGSFSRNRTVSFNAEPVVSGGWYGEHGAHHRVQHRDQLPFARVDVDVEPATTRRPDLARRGRAAARARHDRARDRRSPRRPPGPRPPPRRASASRARTT